MGSSPDQLHEYEALMAEYVQSLCDFFDELDTAKEALYAEVEQESDHKSIDEERRNRAWMRKRTSLILRFKQEVAIPAYQRAVTLYPDGAGDYKVWGYFIDKGEVPSTTIMSEQSAANEYWLAQKRALQASAACELDPSNCISGGKGVSAIMLDVDTEPASVLRRIDNDSGDHVRKGGNSGKKRQRTSAQLSRNLVVKIFLPSVGKTERLQNGTRYWLKKVPVMLLTEAEECKYPPDTILSNYTDVTQQGEVGIREPEAFCRAALLQLGFVIDEEAVSDTVRDKMRWILGWKALSAVLVRVLEIPASILKTYEDQCTGVFGVHSEQLYLHNINKAPHSDTYAVFATNSKGGGPLSSKWSQWDILGREPAVLEGDRLRGLGIGLFTHIDRPVMEPGMTCVFQTKERVESSVERTTDEVQSGAEPPTPVSCIAES